MDDIELGFEEYCYPAIYTGAVAIVIAHVMFNQLMCSLEPRVG